VILYPPEESIAYPHDRLEFFVVAAAAALITLVILHHLWKNDPRR
jgi:hypothetical protein